MLTEVINTILALPRGDKQWIVKRLSRQYPELIDYLNGDKVLDDKETGQLPSWTEQLKQAPVRIIASVLIHGQYPWQQQFLSNCDNQSDIDTQLAVNLSPPCHQLLVTLWFEQQGLNFEQLLSLPQQDGSER